MKGLVKPVIAYNEDIDVWIYYDQLDHICRYEIFYVAYDNSGNPTTLDFVIEEGVLDLRELPQIIMEEDLLPTPKSPWVQVFDHFLLLSDYVSTDIRIPHHLFAQSEQSLKQVSKSRIIKKLILLGYDVLP